MRRRTLALFKALAIVCLGLFGTVAGSIAAVFLTPAGRGLAGRTLSEQLDQLVKGDIEVGAVGGPLWSGLQVDHLVVRDTAGDVVLEADQLTAGYHPLELFAGRIVLTDVTVDGLRLLLEKHRDGHWNVSTILRSRRDTVAAGPTPLVRFDRLTIRGSEVRLLQPWDPPDSARTPAMVAAVLADERKHPGRVIEAGPEGLRKLVTFRRLGGHFPVLQVASPTHAPLRAKFDSLAVVVSDPGVDLRRAAGAAMLEGSKLSIELTDAALPGSHLTARGTVDLAHGGPRFDLRGRASQVALKDLRGFVPGLPDLTGTARATLKTHPDGRLATDVEDLDVRGRQGQVSGRLTALSGANQPVAFKGLDLALVAVDPQILHGWIDTLPLHGTLDGSVKAEGPLQALQVDADLVYRDARVPGHPANRLSVAGLVRLGGANGMVFDTLALRDGDLDLATVRVLVPSNPLEGRARVEGTLVGPWKAVTWRGTAQHRDGERPVSVVRGTVYLDIRGTVPSFDVDLGLAPLVFEGLRGTWPSLSPRGDLVGSVKLHGTSERFSFVSDLHGTMGHLAGQGVMRVSPTVFGFDSLALQFDSLDLSALADTSLHSQLLGTLAGAGDRDSSGGMTGQVALTLGSGWVREVPIDSAAFDLHADAGTIRVDTAFVRWPGGRLEAGGALARSAPQTGTLQLEADVADLGVFDSLLQVLVPVESDTITGLRPLGGRAQLSATVTGAIDSLGFELRAAVREVAWRDLRIPLAHAELSYGGGAAGPITFAAVVDSASWSGWSIKDSKIGARGRRDSLNWEVAGAVGPTDTLVAGGRWRNAGDTIGVALDSLKAALTAHTWQLASPASARRMGGTWQVDSLVVLATDGSGELRLSGALPGSEPGKATLTALGIDLRDLMGMFERDTIGVIGRAAADLELSGTARAPLFHGTFSLAEGGYRDFRAPYFQGALNYADHRLEATALLWRTGRQALLIEADTLPLDLAFTSVRTRKLPGPLYVRVTADSADLGLLEAFTRNLRRVRGGITADVVMRGGWNQPEFGGTVSIVGAAASLPGLGVRWEGMGAKIHLAGDSVVFDTLYARGGAGSIGAQGWARFERDRPPRIDLSVRADRFRAMDVRNYLTLVATGRMQVRGPIFGATLTGSGRADEGALYFADLVTKQIVDLNDPTNADLIDTALVREARLGPSFQNRFVDSLRIENFRLTVGEDFWLRSADANIKLSGAATVNKLARAYRLDGTLTAERGQYTLKMGFINRDFDVKRGTVRFLGTPDLNAELDLTAEHEVKSTDAGTTIDIEARITGTLLVPKLTLVNPANPQMAETDIVSYLMFGRSTAGLQGTNTVEGARQQQAYATAWSYLAPALSSELERTLISDLGVPVDYIQIRPGGIGTNAIEGSASGLTTVTAGWQVGRQTYVALNAGICNNNATDLSYKNFGASLEQRLHRDWRATLSVEPVFTCSTAPGSTTLSTSSLYQLGLDLLWDREY